MMIKYLNCCLVVFWEVAQCGLVVVFRLIGGTCYLHLHGCNEENFDVYKLYRVIGGSGHRGFETLHFISSHSVGVL
jgi:hypothetical protein